MKRALALLSIGIVTAVRATSPIEITWVTPENASVMGFEVEVALEGEAILVNFTGPLAMNDGCEPKRSGAALLDANGSELSFHISDFEPSESKPTVSGYYTDSEHTMTIWIDYLCPASRASDSRRYAVESIAQFLSSDGE